MDIKMQEYRNTEQNQLIATDGKLGIFFSKSLNMHSSSFHILNYTLGVGIPSHQDDIIYMLRFGHKHHSRLLSCDETHAHTNTHTQIIHTRHSPM